MLESSKAFCSLAVSDLAQARRFYQEKLGLAVHTHEMGFLRVELHGSEPLMIYHRPDHQPADFTVLNFPVESVVETVDALKQKGVMMEQYQQPMATNEEGIYRRDDGKHMAWFKDPSGNIIALLEW